VCGTETETSSGWIPVSGPIKGSYVLKNGADDRYDYVSDFGFYVEDPCQVFDNKMNIYSSFYYKTVKDLKYHDGTDSQFWLTNICQDDKALRLLDPSAFPFLELRHGNLAILSTPPNQCTRLEVQHNAPDNSPITNVFYLHMISNFEGAIEMCDPGSSCNPPHIDGLFMESIAGETKTVNLLEQD